MGSDLDGTVLNGRGGSTLHKNGNSAPYDHAVKGPEEPAESHLPDTTATEAAGLLIWIMQALEDAEIEESLAAADAQCGGALASWQPPWSAEGIEELTLAQLSRLPQASVVQSAREFADAVAVLSSRTDRSSLPESNGGDLTVVVPEEGSKWQLEVIEHLTHLAGGQCMREAEWRAKSLEAAVLPESTRIVHLRSLDRTPDPPAAMRESSGGPPAPPAAQAGPHEAQSAAGFKPGFLMSGNFSAQVKDAVEPDAHSARADPADPVRAGARAAPCIQFIHLQSLHLAMGILGEAAALIMGVMQLMNHACTQQAWAVLDDLSGGLVTSWQPPWSAEFIEELTVEHLSRYPESTLLGWAMNVDAFVHFLARFAAAGMKGGWVPGVGYPQAVGPRVEELDAGAARAAEADGAGASSEACAAAEEGGAWQAAAAAAGQPGLACAGLSDTAAVQIEMEDDDDGWEAEASPAACAASAALRPEAAPEEAPEPEQQQISAIVAVLPDAATQWHLEVVGALVSSLGVYMIREQAWRADFASENNVPFSVEEQAGQPQRCDASSSSHGAPSASSSA